MSAEQTIDAVPSSSIETADRVGAVASTVCAVHCAVGAMLPAAFGAMGAGFLMSERLEWIFTLVAVAVGLVALGLGLRRHRSPFVAVLLVCGIVGLVSARLIEEASGHHHDEHHAEAHDGHGDHHAKAHVGEHEAHGGDHHEGGSHLAGTGVAVLGGMALVAGHVVNIRETRRCREDACDDDACA